MESASFYVRSTGNFTIDYLLSLLCILSIECQIYIYYVENVLRATKTRVFHPDVGYWGIPNPTLMTTNAPIICPSFFSSRQWHESSTQGS